jgi:hypothetical protein
LFLLLVSPLSFLSLREAKASLSILPLKHT